MTIIEYAIARSANRLLAEGAKRKLTPDEARLLDKLTPIVLRYERREEEAMRSAPSTSPRYQTGAASR